MQVGMLRTVLATGATTTLLSTGITSSRETTRTGRRFWFDRTVLQPSGRLGTSARSPNCSINPNTDLQSNAIRPLAWTSAEAAGLAIFPGLVRYEEVEAGEIRHAIRVTMSQTQRGYILPANSIPGTAFEVVDSRPVLS